MDDNSHTSEIFKENEVDLRELLATLWGDRRVISMISGIAAAISLVIALLLPNIYTATALLAPAESSGGGMSSLMSQYGGLASLAGVSLPGGDDASRTQLGIELMKSRAFIGQFVERHDILPELMAFESWDMVTGSVTFDPDEYIEKSQKWVRSIAPPFEPKPSLLEAHEAFMEILTISEGKDTGYVTVSIEHQSPVIAAKWVKWLVEDVNAAVKKQDVDEATKSIEYLKEQISKTSLADLQSVFFDLIQSQTETVMLAQVRPEYVFKTIDPPVVPEEKSEPSRALICVIGTFIGAFFGAIAVLLRRSAHSDMGISLS